MAQSQPSLWALQCASAQGHRYNASNSLKSPAVGEPSVASNISAFTLASGTTVPAVRSPCAYEKKWYYNGITGSSDWPDLLYRSDYRTAPFVRPTGRFAQVPVKSVHGVFDTPLNAVWHVVGPEIRKILNDHAIGYSSIDTARFYTHGLSGEDEKGSLGPVVIWIGIAPGSTSPDTAHDVSLEILALLERNKVPEVVVEWRDAVIQRLAGTTTLFFHPFKDEDGNLIDKIYALANCHVLRENWTADYRWEEGGPEDYVRVCGLRRFQRGLADTTKATADALFEAELAARELIRHQATDDQSKVGLRKMERLEATLKRKNEDIQDLEDFHIEVTKNWSNLSLQRNIGRVLYAPAVRVDEAGTEYTADWGVFEVSKAKCGDGFGGNVVFLGSKFTPTQLKELFSRGPISFEYPDDGKLQVTVCAGELTLSMPNERDADGRRCLTVGKDGNSTDLTVGRYSGLQSFLRTETGVESMEVAVYNSGYSGVEPFSDKGDSGALVWYMAGKEAHIVGQLHTGVNIGGPSSIYVSYCTPGWWLLEQVKKEYKFADFFRTSWGT
ncbi:hypothetical protein FB45DRAFT_865374 [Roridomyces roridus]|uniref:Uncharacterized protein n=1 Tax=Roridomyces roridus TaxID=1738132 RepID=A0AAD7BZ26_9AGAR|nr:hypothetical protein FB45DRAFT_865374 [Roridomyces roridus]